MSAYLFSALPLASPEAMTKDKREIRRGALQSDVMPDAMLETMTEKCAHRICSCPARADTGYCGSYCMAASKDPDAGVVCGCGHPECKPGDIPMPTQSS